MVCLSVPAVSARAAHRGCPPRRSPAPAGQKDAGELKLPCRSGRRGPAFRGRVLRLPSEHRFLLVFRTYVKLESAGAVAAGECIVGCKAGMSGSSRSCPVSLSSPCFGVDPGTPRHLGFLALWGMDIIETAAHRQSRAGPALFPGCSGKPRVTARHNVLNQATKGLPRSLYPRA